MKLHDLQPVPGSRREPRRVGRGIAAGRGKTAGRGTKGQKSRAGANLPAWFEGGQTPLHVRTPKLHGFKNRFRVEYAAVNVARLASFEAGTLVTPEVLRDRGLIARSRTSPQPVKILAGGDAPAGITLHAHAFTRAALDKLTAAGSAAVRISWPEGLPLDDEPAVEEASATGGAGAEREQPEAAAGDGERGEAGTAR